MEPNRPYYANQPRLVNARNYSQVAEAGTARACGSSTGPRRGTLATLAFGLLCAFAQGQDQGIDRLVASEAQRLLQHDDPIVRGEAALIVAAAKQREAQPLLLQLAADPAPQTRRRALIALGMIAAPDTVQFLDEQLRATSARGDEDAAAAAFALGMAPQTVSHSAQSGLFSSITKGSWKRQRDTLLAALLGIARDPGRHEAAPLLRLLDDDANRDPEVRALLVHLLLRGDSALDTTRLRRVLARDSDAEREVVLRHLAREGATDIPELHAEVVRLAEKGDSGTVRAAALATLTHWRHVDAVAIATQALRHGGADECGQAMRTLLQQRGGPPLAELEHRILAEPQAAVQAALLANFLVPLSTTLRDLCATLAADDAKPSGLRTTAALALLRGRHERSERLVRDLFRSGGDDADFDVLARALMTPNGEPAPLDSLLSGNTDLRDAPARWLALLRAGHPEAERQVLLRLHERDAKPASLRVTLRTWRRARVLDVPRWRTAAVPSLLRSVLGD